MAKYGIVDLSNLFARAKFVTQGDAFTKAGMALHIVFKSLLKLHRDFAADHIVFAVDNGSWRYAVYDRYKLARKAARHTQSQSDREDSEIFFEALNSLTDYLDAKTNCTVLKGPDTEADDILAAFIAAHPDDEHIIIANDSDFLQLLSPTVKIYDGINDRLIAIDGVTNAAGENLEFTVASNSGKVKFGSVPKVNPNFIPEPDWWRFALWVKEIRGDAGDGIMSAYPGCSFKGTSKRVGIVQAWEDRKDKGYNYNSFMLSEWQKPVGVDRNCEPIFETVVVRDEFARNEMLIDLTKQPDEVKQQLYKLVEEAIQRPPVSKIGFNFMRFCSTNELPGLASEARSHCAYLSLPYKAI